VAELVRSYSNVVLPEFVVPEEPEPLTLEQQAAGVSPLQPSADSGRPARVRHLTTEHRRQVVLAYEQGSSLSSIARQVGISWDSVERISAEAGVRQGRRWRKQFGQRA
jgi:DNA invertase Pin-like site-specific DNA recombinase